MTVKTKRWNSLLLNNYWLAVGLFPSRNVQKTCFAPKLYEEIISWRLDEFLLCLLNWKQKNLSLFCKVLLMSTRNSISRVVASNRPTEALASVISLACVIYSHHKNFNLIPKKGTQPWTDCLSHKFFMDIAPVISFFFVFFFFFRLRAW